MPRLIYSEFAPVPRLRSVVDCLWTVFVDPAGPGQPSHWVIPDGCTTLSVGLQPHFYVRLRRPALIPFRAPCTPGEQIAGLRFRPAVDGSRFTEAIRKQVRAGVSAAEVLALAQHLVDRTVDEPEQRVTRLVSLIRDSEGRGAVTDLALELGVTERHTERLARVAIGLSPKEFARVTRLQGVVRRLIAEPERGLAEVAAGAGFADQTHMTREFQRLGALTPAGYRRMIRDVGFVLEAGPAPQ